MRKIYLLAIVCIISIVGYSNDHLLVSETISKTQFQEDVELLINIVKESHAGLNWYSDADSLINALRNTAAAVDNELPLNKAYFIFNEFISGIRDGHTNVTPGGKRVNQIFEDALFFPMTVQIIDGKMYADQLFIEGSMTKGDEILVLNGKPIIEILAELQYYVSADGRHSMNKLSRLNGEFWWYYGIHYGFPRVFHIDYKTNGKRRKKAILQGISGEYRNSILDKRVVFADYVDPIRYYFSNDVGILEVNRFFGISKSKYEAYLDEAFAAFKENECEEIVIDIRNNGGGREGFENKLFSYLPNSLEQKYDDVLMTSITSEFYEYMENPLKNRVQDKFIQWFEFHKEDDGNWHRKERFERDLIPSDHQFDGEIYILIGPEVFSGASEFASMATDYCDNCLLAGEETSGGYQGNTSGYFYDFVLPHTQFELSIPRIKFDLNTKDQNNSGGVLPDVWIPYTPSDCMRDDDIQLTYLLNWISENKLTVDKRD